MLFNCFAFAVAFVALASRHRWKQRAKTAEYFADSLASDVIQGMKVLESVSGQNKISSVRPQ